MHGKFYRRDLAALAKEKYVRVCKGFRKRKTIRKSRRTNSSN